MGDHGDRNPHEGGSGDELSRGRERDSDVLGPRDDRQNQLEPETWYTLEYQLKNATEWDLLATIDVGPKGGKEVWDINTLAVSYLNHDVENLRLTEMEGAMTSLTAAAALSSRQQTTNTHVDWAKVSVVPYVGPTFTGEYSSGTSSSKLSISFTTALVNSADATKGELITKTDWFNPLATPVNLEGGSVTLTRTAATDTYTGYKATAKMDP